MRRAFLDTSFLVALVLRKDQHHEAAGEFLEVYDGELVTTEYVLVEVHDALCQVTLRSLAVATTDELLAEPDISLVPASTDLLHRGRELFRNRPDKEWSLTDCISFVVMDEQGIRDALAYDHHFTQAGFNVLTK